MFVDDHSIVADRARPSPVSGAGVTGIVCWALTG